MKYDEKVLEQVHEKLLSLTPERGAKGVRITYEQLASYFGGFIPENYSPFIIQLRGFVASYVESVGKKSEYYELFAETVDPEDDTEFDWLLVKYAGDQLAHQRNVVTAKKVSNVIELNMGRVNKVKTSANLKLESKQILNGVETILKIMQKFVPALVDKEIQKAMRFSRELPEHTIRLALENAADAALHEEGQGGS
jgi:hypothetical protein